MHPGGSESYCKPLVKAFVGLLCSLTVFIYKSMTTIHGGRWNLKKKSYWKTLGLIAGDSSVSDCQSCTVAPSCLILRPHWLKHTRLPWSSPFPEVCSNSRPSSQWCHPRISPSVTSFSCLRSFPASGSSPVSRLCIRSEGQSQIDPSCRFCFRCLFEKIEV